MTEETLPSAGPLGRRVESAVGYSPDLLFPLSRQAAREELGIASESLPFTGIDVWTAYELSWLNLRGKPVIATGLLEIPCDSPCMVESKSLKLYLGSLNQNRFASVGEVAATIERDLSACVGLPVAVTLFEGAQTPRLQPALLSGKSLDQLDIAVDCYSPNPELLERPTDGVVHECWHTDLFRSQCPVTGQPDWASVSIEYRGQAIGIDGLLRYLISYREHSGFHEQCVERIFTEIMAVCRPEALTVFARFLRRGGLDINPWRSTGCKPADMARLIRQ